MARLAENALRLRQEAGISQATLAQRAELDEGVVARLEEGSSSPSAEDFYRLTGALGVEPGAFFAGVRWTPPAAGGKGFEFS